MRDETLYPPRCCRQNIPVAQVRPHLSHTLVIEFQQKSEEFGTLKRVYCSSPTCSRFLGPLSEGSSSCKVYTCPTPTCKRRTCGSCREQYSGLGSHVCRPDADTAQVLALGRTAGWSRCPGCSQMIELNMGCFHMTCRCRTEFCYLCRARWKTCRCPQWGGGRPSVVAERRVNVQLRAARGNRAQRAAFVDELRRAHARAHAPPTPPTPPPPLPPKLPLLPTPTPAAPLQGNRARRDALVQEPRRARARAPLPPPPPSL
ncbi:hypothetical protein PAXINDRAFT_19589 [Paxillus involutus ATCC 200175]|uniref:RBR-type E3 ubiquitin transferase n=1 Tax=Paxillus involutus ATCC 200175 TaxID=664439 RepID=A0A0C9SWM0_PAXIN|nr:hypothetical protein PAXINDRAFT_19589 [Paxillus involutus ATCC 200175]